MRLIALTFFAMAALSALSAEPAQPYPLWDGHETIAEYAKKTGLEPTKTLDLGDGVKLELVLIPAGKFIMGTPEPEPVGEEGFITQIAVGVAALALSSGVLLVMLAFVIVRAVREKHRPQVSLARLLVLAVLAGVGLLGGLHSFYTAHAQSEYEAAMARFKISYNCEKPAHEVTLTKPFYLGKYEVTQEQYQQVMGANPSRFKGRDLPVEQVSWNDAQEFCKKVSDKTGSVVRLPTDAEWERACRAGTKTTYYTGDAETDLDRAGWYEKNSKWATHPVGQKTPNAWGVYDMHGNVWETCADRFEAYKSDPAVDPQGTAQYQGCVLRGGSWNYGPKTCGAAFRAEDIPGPRGINLGHGFRVAMAAPRTP
jgi:formylglycine-generating enzyme required for sulfatase activity